MARHRTRRTITTSSYKTIAQWAILAIAIAIGVMWFRNIFQEANAAEYTGDGRTEAEYLTVRRDGDKLPSTLLQRKGMTISFNPETHIPNWVAWELTRDEVKGSEPRANKFFEDTKVKGSATPGDYSYSGYDRGHMVPAGDMKWDSEAMMQTFWMTNIAPQVHQLNSGPWKTLEEKCRIWARVDSAIYIICGPVPQATYRERIGATQVAVPEQFFKVILSPFAQGGPRGIGFVMKNGANPGGLQPTARSIDEVEALTGYDFFSVLPDDVEAQVESQKKFNLWSTLKAND